MTKRSRKFVVWQISDGKPGHERQVAGLVNALERILTESKLELHMLTGGFINSLKQLHIKNKYFPKAPNLIVGAGHKTHLTLILLSKIYGGRSVCLMKPSIPTKFFDLCIVPKHDRVKGSNIFVTQGPLNPLKNCEENKTGGLILIGGPSKHFHFIEDVVLESINNIINSESQFEWSVADSRRTPAKIKKSLIEIQSSSLKYYDSNHTNSHALDRKLEKTEYVWITADSMAMIYEALTAGAKVGIIDLPQKIDSKLVRHIKALKDRQIANREEPFLKIQICESETIAKKIINLFSNEFQA